MGPASDRLNKVVDVLRFHVIISALPYSSKVCYISRSTRIFEKIKTGQEALSISCSYGSYLGGLKTFGITASKL